MIQGYHSTFEVAEMKSSYKIFGIYLIKSGKKKPPHHGKGEEVLT